jgi:hypothetical protein
MEFVLDRCAEVIFRKEEFVYSDNQVIDAETNMRFEQGRVYEYTY